MYTQSEESEKLLRDIKGESERFHSANLISDFKLNHARVAKKSR